MPCGQLHMGTWLITSQIAFKLQVPEQGSMHLFLEQALSRGQSELSTHSGLQPTYGSPWCSSIQVHNPSLQIAFVPHGDGLHLSMISASKSKV